MREVGRREEELALEGGRWWREALDVGLWDALEAGRTGRVGWVLGIVVTVAFNLQSARNLHLTRKPLCICQSKPFFVHSRLFTFWKTA